MRANQPAAPASRNRKQGRPKISNAAVLLEGKLHRMVRPDDSTWELEDAAGPGRGGEKQRVLTLTLRKALRTSGKLHWRCVLQGARPLPLSRPAPPPPHTLFMATSFNRRARVSDIFLLQISPPKAIPSSTRGSSGRPRRTWRRTPPTSSWTRWGWTTRAARRLGRTPRAALAKRKSSFGKVHTETRGMRILCQASALVITLAADARAL